MRILCLILLFSCQIVQKKNISQNLLELHQGKNTLPEIKRWIDTSDKKDSRNTKIYLVFYIESYYLGECPSIDEQIESTIVQNADQKYIDEFFRIKRSCDF